MKRLIWKIKAPSAQASAVAGDCGISVALAQILINRNIDPADIPQFLNSSMEGLHPWSLLPDVQKAVKRITEAAHAGERIFVVSDYDVDGITSLAIFHEFAKRYPDQFIYSIPHRVKDGYGLNKEAVERAKQENAKLLICFDCGTNARSELALADEYGIDVIVVDHHHAGGQTNAYAFINPKRADSKYPFTELSGAALSFKLLQALLDGPCEEMLDLVALSLVCDVVPLKGENRILVKEGIRALRKSKRPAIKALCSASRIKQENIEHFHIGFILGPRLNASGRVASAHEALEMFLTDDTEKIESIVAKLQGYNQLRKSIEADILKEAEGMIDQANNDYAIVVHGDGWHPGVLGIVASRLADKYYRPAFAISFDDGFGKGSGRSIHSVHLIEALDQCSQYLNGYGGHKKAAGISLHKETLSLFKDTLNSFIRDAIDPKDLVPILEIDLEIAFGDITLDFTEELSKLSPHGEENPQVVFMSKGVSKRSDPKKSGSKCVVWFSDGIATHEGVIPEELSDLVKYAKKFDIAFSLEKNLYHNTVRLIIRDLKVAEDPL